MSSGDAGQRLLPVTRCCSAPTLAAPRWHGPQPGYGLQLGFPLNAAKGHSRARAQLDRPGGFRYQQQQHLAGLLPHGPKGTRPLGLQPDVTPAVSRAGDALVGLGEGEKRRKRQEGSGEVRSRGWGGRNLRKVLGWGGRGGPQEVAAEEGGPRVMWER